MNDNVDLWIQKYEILEALTYVRLLEKTENKFIQAELNEVKQELDQLLQVWNSIVLPSQIMFNPGPPNETYAVAGKDKMESAKVSATQSVSVILDFMVCC